MGATDHRHDRGALARTFWGAAGEQMLQKTAAQATRFADNRGLYPVDTPADAALSMLYAVAQGAPEATRQKLSHYLALHGVNVETVVSAASNAQKTAQAPPVQAWALPSLRRWRIDTPEQLSKAAEALAYQGPTLPVATRVEAAHNIAKQAAALGVEAQLPEAIKRYAGGYACDRQKLADTLSYRGALSATPAGTTAFYKVAQDVLAMRDTDPGLYDPVRLTKLASAVARLDHEHGTQQLVQRGVLPDAVLAVFNSQKEAAPQLEVSGTMVPLHKLARMPQEFFANALGDEFAQEVCSNGAGDPVKLADVVPTLPRDLKSALGRAISQYVR